MMIFQMTKINKEKNISNRKTYAVHGDSVSFHHGHSFRLVIEESQTKFEKKIFVTFINYIKESNIEIKFTV